MATGSGGRYHHGGNGGASRAWSPPATVTKTVSGKPEAPIAPTVFIPGEGKPEHAYDQDGNHVARILIEKSHL